MRRGESVRDYVYRAWRAGDGRFTHPVTGDLVFPTLEASFEVYADAVLVCCVEGCQIPRLTPGDAACCTRCGEWYTYDGRPAGELAREPMPVDEVLAAFATAEEKMAR